MKYFYRPGTAAGIALAVLKVYWLHLTALLLAAPQLLFAEGSKELNQSGGYRHGRYPEAYAKQTVRQDTLAITYNIPAKNSKDGVSRLELRFFAACRDEWKALPPFPYNNPDYSIGLPAFHPDGKVLFFTSDMPGGLGGKDIYYSQRIDSGWASPVNAGPLVNTAGDDMFPYVSPEGVLYFSSNRWPGLGGLDIFKVKLDGQYKAIAAPENLGAPFNSPRNDFSILWKNNGTGGYFSSDRRGNDDIYGFSK